MLTVLVTTATSASASTGTAASSVTPAVFDAQTGVAWAGSEVTGAEAYNTAAVAGAGTTTPTGTVTYNFFPGDSCLAPATSVQTVTLATDGTVPNSAATSQLGAGSYSYQDVYSGDGNYASSAGNCQPFTVAKIGGSTAVTILDAATKAAWSGAETPGAAAYQGTLVSSTPGFIPTGTVTIDLLSGGCAGTMIQAQTLTLNPDGTTPNSATTGPLAAGNYCYQTWYSGDSNYNPSATYWALEAFKVTGPTAAVDDASTQAAWSGGETGGSSAYATSTLVGAGTTTPTGTVTYSLFDNQTCAGSATASWPVSVNADGTVPNSPATGPLAGGSYSYQVSYSGDGTTPASTAGCEPFTVVPALSTTTGAVYDGSTHAAWSGGETGGVTAYATSTVVGTGATTPTGTVTYTLFDNQTCAGSATASWPVSVNADGTVPNSPATAPLTAGSHAYQVSYSGDGIYPASTAGCEPFTVAPAASTTAGAVYDQSTHAAWSGGETGGASAYATSTVVGTGPITPTGSVTYSLFDNQTCAGSATASWPVSVNADGTVPNSPATAPLTAGSHAYQVSYSGDGIYPASTAGCEPFTVAPALSTTGAAVYDGSTHAAWSGNETAGASAYETATVTGGVVTPTGTVTYRLFHNQTCTLPAAATWPVSVSTDGTVPNSPGTGALAAGSYSYQASYSGDPTYASSTGACKPFTVLTPARVTGHESAQPGSGAEVQRGEAITYSVTASNAGQASAGSVTITDTTPAGTSYIANSARCPVGITGCVHTRAVAGGRTQITWVFPLKGGAVAGVSFRVIVTSLSAASTSITNSAVVNGVGTNVVTEYAVYPSIHLSVTASPVPVIVHRSTGHVARGQVISYTIHWSNTGSADAKNATVTDIIPVGTTYRPGSVREGGRLQGRVLVWSGLYFPAGRSGVLTFQVTANRGDRAGTHIVDLARVSSQVRLLPTLPHPAGSRAPGAVAYITPALSATSNQTVHIVVS